MPDSTKTQQPTVEQLAQIIADLPKRPAMDEIMKAQYCGQWATWPRVIEENQ
jgi:hypothetical protein